MKVFLCSPDYGIETERALAKYCLEKIHKTGGPELEAYENYLRQHGVKDRAIDEGLHRVTWCHDLILLLKERAGSPCFSKTEAANNALKEIQDWIKSKRSSVYQFFEENGKTLPPISWVELFLFSEKNNTADNFSPSVFGMIHKETQRLALDYKKQCEKSRAGKDISTALSELFKTNYNKVFEVNRYGSGGKKYSDNETICKVAWLCEFVLWFFSKNFICHNHGLPEHEIIPREIEERYKGFRDALSSGTFWVEGQPLKIGKVLYNLGMYYKNEIWVFHNDLFFLIDNDLFHQTYQAHIAKYSCIKIVLKQQQWDNLTKNNKTKIKQNLSMLENETNKIKIFIDTSDKYNGIGGGFITIMGVHRYGPTNGVMVFRPLKWHKKHRDMEINITLSPSPSDKIIHTVFNDVKDIFNGSIFECLADKIANEALAF